MTMRILTATLLLILPSFAVPPRAFAKVTETIMEVNLANTTTGNVSKIQFEVTSPQLTPAMVDLGLPGNISGAPGTVVKSDNGGGTVGVILVLDVKVLKPTEVMKLKVIVPGAKQITITGAKWLDATDTALTPRPKFPGFKVVTKDLDYTLLNDLIDPFGIQNLAFLPNITPAAFDALDLDTILNAPFNSSLPSFSMSPFSFSDFPGLPDPDLGNFFAAEGQILDDSGIVVGSFIHGVEVAPEPSTILLLGSGLSCLGVFAWRRRRSARLAMAGVRRN